MKLLGKGSYGKVYSENNNAIKKFSSLKYIIQEYGMLIYLRDSKYIVECNDVNFNELSLSMELYDMNLYNFIEEVNLNKKLKYKITQQILYGVIEIHDRNLVHGDIKLHNILVKKSPLKIAIGDCGFVSFSKYSKVDLTTPTYRDPKVIASTSHDIFSFGICLFEIFGGKKIIKPCSYNELINYTNLNIKDEKIKNILYNIFNRNINKRFNAREIYQLLFNEKCNNTVKHIELNYEIIYKKIRSETNDKVFKSLLTLFLFYKNKFDINRSKKGLFACLYYINKYKCKNFKVVGLGTIYILISFFKCVNFNHSKMEQHIKHICTFNEIKYVIYSLINDNEYMKLIMS